MSDRQVVELTVRAPEAGDMEALADLMTQLGYETRTSEMQMRMETIMANKQYATFVAVSEGKVCGMIGTRISYSYEHNNPGAAILALIVSENMRGRGVGEALVTAAENDLTQKNIRRLAVYTHFRRTRAHEFYEKMGYEKNGFRLVKELPVATD
ncbi:MAG TPA: GNAT family N-acetyltransferase [Chthoniobacterales bacterium]|jgi:ribosomal protein S18 acetylase RimI-like enzyme|nr:GNAT family N-acetyltransferase [Chthoniobacterales bacterium]